MTQTRTIPGTEEAWDDGTLGCDEAHAVRVSDEVKSDIDDALGMTAISIRLPKALIEEFKTLATIHKVGYQPLMRDALKRFATAEMKQIAARIAAEMNAPSEKAESDEPHDHGSGDDPLHRHAA